MPDVNRLKPTVYAGNCALLNANRCDEGDKPALVVLPESPDGLRIRVKLVDA